MLPNLCNVMVTDMCVLLKEVNLINSKGNWIALTAYGVGTGLPVMIFAFVIAFAVNQIGKFYQATITFEKYARRFTGLLFICIGSYYLWRIF